MSKHYSGVIPKGSTIKIIVNGDYESDISAAKYDIQVEPNSLMILQGGTLGTPIRIENVEQISANEYVFHALWQDCLVMLDRNIVSHYSDIVG